jgi:hypothetical protein
MHAKPVGSPMQIHITSGFRQSAFTIHPNLPILIGL